MKRLICLLLLFSAVPGPSQNLYKQFDFVTVEGRVVARDGKVVPDCMVEIRVLSNQASREEGSSVTGTSPTAGSGEGDVYALGTGTWDVNNLTKAGWAKTDADGHYKISGIPAPGSYLVVVKGMKGFKKTQMPLRIDKPSADSFQAKDLILDRYVDMDGKTRKLLKKADRALKAGKLDEAEKLLNEAKNHMPDLAAVYVSLGNIALKRKNVKLAYENFSKAFDLGEQNPELCKLTAKIAFNTRQFDDSLKYLDAVLEQTPNDANSLYLAGVCKYNQKKFDGAEKYFERYLKAKKGESHELNFLYVYGMTELALDKKEQAAKYLNLAYKNGLKPNAVFLQRLAGIYLELNKKQEAKGVLKDLLDKFPTFEGRNQAQKVYDSL